MASKKQRRRRAKERRHEYEYVYVDEEGQEVEPPPEELDDRRDGKKADAKSKNGKPAPRKSSAPKARDAKGRPIRPVPPPSWQRVLKRGAIFAPFMFLTITLLARDLTISQRLIQTAYLLILFIPFSYFVDRFMYRRYLQQTGKLPESKKRGAR